MLLALTAILSANIALMNLLPIPVLDGGQLVLCALEALRRQPVSARLQQAGNAIGVTLIVALLLLTTTLDLARLDPFGWAGMR
jgi:regulator of sigma E protease